MYFPSKENIFCYILVVITISCHYMVRSESEVPDQRPALENRTFTSAIVEEVLQNIGVKIKDDTIRQIFINCLPNTLDTTVLLHRYRGEDNSSLDYTYIITGDIQVMWIRDSTFQVNPYIPLASGDDALSSLILGLINTQSEMLSSYQWANAYYPLDHWNSGIIKEPNIWGANDSVHPQFDIETVFEAKYELDSLACFLYLSSKFYEETGNKEFLQNSAWIQAVREVVRVMKLEQVGTIESLGSEPYTFTRETRTQSETQNLNGKGNPVKRCGLLRSFFRPSDDSSIFHFHIPSNAFSVVGLSGVARLLNENNMLPDLANELEQLAIEVDTAIRLHGIVSHPNPDIGLIYAYEVDCYGSQVLMDDAGYPSLLSLPALGYLSKSDEVYLNTRKYILSAAYNPYYTQGLYPSVGSPHAGLQQSWPMAIAMQGLTSTSEDEILWALWTLRNTTGGTGLMHESFDVNEPANFTRPWFAWANTLFGEFILHLDKEYPHLL